MDSSLLDHNGKSVEEASAEQLPPPDSPDISDKFGDPQVLPRVGKEYQADIPPMLTESEQLQLLRNPADSEISLNVSHYFLMGLPIPVMWIDDKIDNHGNKRIGVNKRHDNSVNGNGSLGSRKAKKSRLLSKKKGVKDKTLDVELDKGEKWKSVSSEATMVEKIKLDQTRIWGSHFLVPGSLGDSSWTDIEVNSFLLALYVFGKNLIQVKRFMENKEMGDILSFYYGKFYGYQEHRRYSNFRRMMKSKKCKIGHRILTGWRQQELLSRLFLHVSEEAKSTLVEVSKAFAEERTSLEDYVDTLKTTVSIPILIEAVGIGREKEDLTNPAMEPTKNNQVFSVQPEVPVGKACSSLTCGDIIKFLTGDFRLSKARSNDIFWEAVWPRLLARGWHSEQPKNHVCFGSKHQLVFLIPGIEKFSRRKLVKRDHYFDCVADVLRRVASEPELIELDAEKPTLDNNVLEDHQKHSYLKPRSSTCIANSTVFTIVDTSLISREKSLQVRELRILPADTKNPSSINDHTKEAGDDFSGDSLYEPHCDDMLLKGQKKPKSCNLAKVKVDCSNSKKRLQTNGSEGAKKLVEHHQDQDTVLSNEEQSRTIKNQLSQRARPGCSNLLPPLMKRRRLASCLKDETSRNMDKFMVRPGLNEVGPSFMSNSPDASTVVPFHEKVSLCSSSTEGSPKKESTVGILHENISGIEISPLKVERPQSRPLIDLNVPQTPLESENDEFRVMEVDDSLQNPSVDVSCVSSELYEPKILSNSIDVAAEKPPVVNPRRQSTRNRPLTMRALEALESGFLGTNRRRKGRER